MTQPFGHEKLVVYQKGMRFVALRRALLDGLVRRVAACDHLDRGAESILVNIAHASNTWSPKERIVYLGHANGSALECAACLDVLVAKALLAPEAAAIILNIAEGNGRFTGADQSRSYKTAYCHPITARNCTFWRPPERESGERRGNLCLHTLRLAASLGESGGRD